MKRHLLILEIIALCLLTFVNFMAIPVQLVFLILKWTNGVGWNWTVVLIPIMCWILSFAISVLVNCFRKANNEKKQEEIRKGLIDELKGQLKLKGDKEDDTQI